VSTEPKGTTLPASALPASALPGVDPSDGSPDRSEGAARDPGVWHPYSERRPTALERAAERYREAWQADRAAASEYAAAYFAWRKAGMPCEGPEHAALKPVRDACDRTEREHEAAHDALLAAARGAP